MLNSFYIFKFVFKMKLKDLYEQYELKKNDNSTNIRYKQDRIFETENYMFYYPWHSPLIELNPDNDDYQLTNYFNEHILTDNFEGKNINEKIKNLFNTHLKFFKEINNTNYFFFLDNIKGYSDWNIPNKNEKMMIELANSNFMHNSNSSSLFLVNDIFIDDGELNVNGETYIPNYDEDDPDEPFTHYDIHHNKNNDNLSIKFLYREK